MRANFSDRDIFYLMWQSLLYNIRSNVRMITMKFDPGEPAKMKLCCYTDTVPVELDTELMEDSVTLFEAYKDCITTQFEIVVECRLGPWNEIWDGRNILYARYEPRSNA
jgi:hypothetical protein